MPGIKFFGDTKEFEKQAFDYHMPMGSLPRLFRSDIKDFDRTAHGYLKADKLRVDILRREMGLEGKRVIGISWKSIRSLTTSKKSMMLKDFGMMFKGMDVVLLNLQYGDVQEEIDEFTQATGIEILQCGSVDNREDLDGLAALIELCDLVVSTRNITIHLAGALGKETWVLVSTHGGIWWLLDRTDSIWYPALRLYRQKTLDDWGGVLSNINKDLEEKIWGINMNQSVKDQKINNLIALYSQGEITRAISEAQKLTKVYKKEPFLFNFLGVASVGIGSIDAAVKYYKEALSLNPQYYEVYNNIGLAYNDLKKPNVAIKYLNKAIQIFPDYAEAYNNIGNTQKELGNTSEAVENYKKAISINPNYVDAYTNLGIVHSVLDEFDEAEKAFKKALSLDLSNKNVAYYLADNCFNREFLDQAIKILDKYFKEDQTPDSMNLRGKVLQKKGSEKALDFYFQALKSSNRKDEVLSNIGSFYYAKREIKSAIKIL